VFTYRDTHFVHPAVNSGQRIRSNGYSLLVGYQFKHTPTSLFTLKEFCTIYKGLEQGRRENREWKIENGKWKMDPGKTFVKL